MFTNAWQLGPSRTAVVYQDAPRGRPSRPPWISEHLMRQLRTRNGPGIPSIRTGSLVGCQAATAAAWRRHATGQSPQRLRITDGISVIATVGRIVKGSDVILFRCGGARWFRGLVPAGVPAEVAQGGGEAEGTPGRDDAFLDDPLARDSSTVRSSSRSRAQASEDIHHRKACHCRFSQSVIRNTQSLRVVMSCGVTGSATRGR